MIGDRPVYFNALGIEGEGLIIVAKVTLNVATLCKNASFDLRPLPRIGEFRERARCVVKATLSSGRVTGRFGQFP